MTVSIRVHSHACLGLDDESQSPCRHGKSKTKSQGACSNLNHYLTLPLRPELGPANSFPEFLVTVPKVPTTFSS